MCKWAGHWSDVCSVCAVTVEQVLADCWNFWLHLLHCRYNRTNQNVCCVQYDDVFMYIVFSTQGEERKSLCEGIIQWCTLGVSPHEITLNSMFHSFRRLLYSVSIDWCFCPRKMNTITRFVITGASKGSEWNKVIKAPVFALLAPVLILSTLYVVLFLTYFNFTPF